MAKATVGNKLLVFTPAYGPDVQEITSGTFPVF